MSRPSFFRRWRFFACCKMAKNPQKPSHLRHPKAKIRHKKTKIRSAKIQKQSPKTWKIGCTKRYLARGRNAELLFLRLKREKIPLICFKKRENEVVLEVPAKHHKKAVAILRAMCYNIIRESTGGKALPLYYLSRRVGAVLGAAVFLAGCLLARPVVLSVEYRGGAAYRKAEFAATLQEAGISLGACVSTKTLQEAKKALYAAYPSLYFVSVEKHGFHVVVTAQGATIAPAPVFVKTLTAPDNGVVLRVNVLRGTPTVCVGDAVFCGDALASGTYLSGEQEIDGFVVGEVVLFCRHSESVLLPEERKDFPAMLLSYSLHQRGIESPTEVQLTIEKEAEGYRHTASFAYAIVVRGG